MWKRIGFLRFAADYWLLAVLIVRRIDSKAQLYNRFGFAVDSAAQERAFPSREELELPVLPEYDNTSMRQLNDLITEFQLFDVQTPL